MASTELGLVGTGLVFAGLVGSWWRSGIVEWVGRRQLPGAVGIVGSKEELIAFGFLVVEVVEVQDAIFVKGVVSIGFNNSVLIASFTTNSVIVVVKLIRVIIE